MNLLKKGTSPLVYIYDQLMRQGPTCYSESNFALAYDRYVKASDAGCREAMKAAGDMLYEGIGVELDESKAMEYYLRAGGFTPTESEPYFERAEDGLEKCI